MFLEFWQSCAAWMRAKPADEAPTCAAECGALVLRIFERRHDNPSPTSSAARTCNDGATMIPSGSRGSSGTLTVGFDPRSRTAASLSHPARRGVALRASSVGAPCVTTSRGHISRMTVAAVPLSTSEQPVGRAVLVTWLVTAAWDFLCASALSVFAYGSTFSRFWQGVASVPLGPTAFTMGARGVAAGLGFHLLVALTWSAIFVLAAARSVALRRLLDRPVTALGVVAIYERSLLVPRLLRRGHSRRVSAARRLDCSPA